MPSTWLDIRPELTVNILADWARTVIEHRDRTDKRRMERVLI